MNCCNNTITSFAVESVTTVPYTGVKPTVSVLYLQPDGSFLQMGVFTQINIQPTSVIINHGGVASGIVKFSQ